MIDSGISPYNLAPPFFFLFVQCLVHDFEAFCVGRVTLTASCQANGAPEELGWFAQDEQRRDSDFRYAVNVASFGSRESEVSGFLMGLRWREVI